MDQISASWIVWTASALIFLGAIQFIWQIQVPGRRDFREVAGGLALLGLGTSALQAELRWHLLWYTPASIVIAYLYSLRGLLALSHRVNKTVDDLIADPKDLSAMSGQEVDVRHPTVAETTIVDSTRPPEPADRRSRVFMPVADFERSIGGLSPQDRREARITFVADAMSLYDDESQWKRRLRPPYFVWCVVPLLWPILWYRNGLSKMTLSALSRVIDDCRSRWSDDLHASGLQFDQYHDPLTQSENHSAKDF